MTIDKFLEENGVADNVMESERRGLEKLRKRVDVKELVVVKTDKSGKLAIVEWEVINEVRNLVAGHLRVLSKVFNPGENLGEKAMKRTIKAKNSTTLTIPNMSVFIKDHKKVGE